MINSEFPGDRTSNPLSCLKILKFQPFIRSTPSKKPNSPFLSYLLIMGNLLGKKLFLVAFQQILQNNLQHQHDFFKKASWNQFHWRIAIKLKLISLINQFPPYNPMWETLTFSQNYRAVIEIIFKLFKKWTDFLHFLNVQVLTHSSLNISLYHHGVYPKSKDKYPFNRQSGVLWFISQKPSCITVGKVCKFVHC